MATVGQQGVAGQAGGLGTVGNPMGDIVQNQLNTTNDHMAGGAPQIPEQKGKGAGGGGGKKGWMLGINIPNQPGVKASTASGPLPLLPPDTISTHWYCLHCRTLNQDTPVCSNPACTSWLCFHCGEFFWSGLCHCDVRIRV